MKDLIRMNQLAGLITESQARKMMAVLNEYVEMDLNDLGPEFEKTIKEIFGETVKVIDIKATYRPSTDTGSKPSLYMSITIPQTKESNKALLLSIEFDKEGNGFKTMNTQELLEAIKEQVLLIEAEIDKTSAAAKGKM
jgi:hypothetical protein